MGYIYSFSNFWIFWLFFTFFTLAMYKKLKFKGGLRLFKGPYLPYLFLPSVPEAMFIQGATFILDSRV